MYYFDDFVYKNNDFILQTLSSLSELSDPAKTEDKLNSFTLSVKIKSWVSLNQRVRDDSSTKFTKASLQQSTNFEYS